MIVAWDARLISSRSTGDSAYWRGLLAGFAELSPPDFRLLLYSNAPRPAGIPDGAAFEWVELAGKGGRWWSLAQFPAAARRAGADVIHTQYAISPLAGRRSVSTFHDISFRINPGWFSAKDARLLSAAFSLAARTAGAVITVSETSQREIEDAEPGLRGRVAWTHNALPVSFPMLSAEEGAAIRQAKGWTAPYCLTVGTRWPRKNMGLAARAMDALPPRLPHRLMISGKAGWGESELGERGVATGWLDDDELAALYQGAAALLCPSWHEGFGIPILEGFASGCPVICGPGGAMPEVAGGAALVTADYETATWTAAIAGLLSSPEEQARLRSLGEERLGAFSWRAAAEKTLSVYQSVAGR
jgi:alpha-1,3-rhamnosyl/mannosyltransferase